MKEENTERDELLDRIHADIAQRKAVAEEFTTCNETDLNNLISDLTDLETKHPAFINFFEFVFGYIEKNTDYKVIDEVKRTPAIIIKEVAEKYGVTVEDMKGKSRKREIVEARQYAMWLIRQERRWDSSLMMKVPIYTQAFTGGLFGKDHATVIHAEKAINNRIETNQLIAR